MQLDHVTIRNEFRVYAMKRSGHHAVMSWLMAHFPGPVYFLNNCSFADEVRFTSTRAGTLDRQILFSGRVSVFILNRRVIRRVEHLEKDALLDRPTERLAALQRAECQTLDGIEFPAEWDAYFFNLEDFDLRHHAHIPFAAAGRGAPVQVRDVIVLRDPFNWLASRYQGNFPVNPSVLDAWCSQCREALRETQILCDPLVIDYDRWFSEPGYRRGISAQLGFAGDDPGIGVTADFGGGSSFSGFRFRDRPDEMDVLNRWKILQNDSGYRRLFRDCDELLDLSQRMFPDGPRPGFLN